MTTRKFWLIVTMCANVLVSAYVWLQAVADGGPLQAQLFVLSWLCLNVITLIDLIGGDDHAH